MSDSSSEHDAARGPEPDGGAAGQSLSGQDSAQPAWVRPAVRLALLAAILWLVVDLSCAQGPLAGAVAAAWGFVVMLDLLPELRQSVRYWPASYIERLPVVVFLPVFVHLVRFTSLESAACLAFAVAATLPALAVGHMLDQRRRGNGRPA